MSSQMTNVVHDSLPYHDKTWNDAAAYQVEQMVREEMTKFKPEEPNDDNDDLFDSSKFLFVTKELDRIGRDIPLPKMDMSRYSLEKDQVPTFKDHKTVAEWNEKYNELGTQLEHSNTQLANLELMLKYGSISWKANATHCDKLAQRAMNELQKLKEEIDEVNRLRKAQQLEAGQSLERAVATYAEYLARNAMLEEACGRLAQEIESLKAQTE